jgi:hypothetical protein
MESSAGIQAFFPPFGLGKKGGRPSSSRSGRASLSFVFPQFGSKMESNNSNPKKAEN